MIKRPLSKKTFLFVLVTISSLIVLFGPIYEAMGADSSSLDNVLMVNIPAGPFIMGSRSGEGREDESPQRLVDLDSYSIDQVEVTNSRYLAFAEATGHKLPRNPYGNEPLSKSEGIQKLPVVQVGWYDAFEYCHWAGKRLPSEAEWEKAARGTNGNLYPWGTKSPRTDLAVFGKNWVGIKTLLPVGSLPKGRSDFNVDDMAGNVREWIQDWYHPEYYSQAPDKNPKGPDEGILKVIRGGSWHHQVYDLRSASRDKGGFGLKTDGIGFRCAKDGIQ
jgi:formylglycine-generating enzyme required for sulfatase activity